MVTVTNRRNGLIGLSKGMPALEPGQSLTLTAAQADELRDNPSVQILRASRELEWSEPKSAPKKDG